ncbi:MAG TPA: tetratricopeptide repeat protein [Pirellulaceae bacterium]|nr:tetratricopeptide repeat protein [Pirellulaceae bacterium]
MRHLNIPTRPGNLLLAAALLVIASGCRMVSTGRNVDGVRYFQQGQYPVALQRFDAAMSIDPRNPDSYYNKGAIYHKMGLAERNQNLLTQAESLYQQCLAYNPDHVDAHRGLAVLLTETGRVPQSFDLLKSWVARSPQNADARVELARLYEEYGDRQTAEQALNDALAVNMQNWRAHAALGRLREQSGDLAQALQNYERSYTLNHFQPQLEQRIADLRGKVSPLAPGTTTPLPGTTIATRNAAAPAPFRRY